MPDSYRPSLQLALWLWKLVFRVEAAHPAGDEQDHESQPCSLRTAGAHQKVPPIVLFRAYRAVSELIELRRAVLKLDNLVCR